MSNVTLIGYGSGNVASVRFALERLGARVRITADPADLDEAERVILPGVGAAGYAMQRLNALGLVEPLRRFQRRCWASAWASSCCSRPAPRMGAPTCWV